MAVQLKKLVDVRVDSTQAVAAVHDVTLGGANLVLQPFNPTSSSPSNLDFVIQTPGLGIFMSRRVNLSLDLPLQFDFVVDPSQAGRLFSFGSDFGTCAWPLNSLISSATVNVSSTSFTTQQQQVLPLIKRFMDQRAKASTVGEVASSIGAAAHIQNTDETSWDMPPLTAGDAIGDSGIGGNCARPQLVMYDASGNVQPYVVLAPGVNTIRCVLKLNEPLLVQPFEYSSEQASFINVNLITVRLNLSAVDAALARILRFPVSEGIDGLDSVNNDPKDADYNSVIKNTKFWTDTQPATAPQWDNPIPGRSGMQKANYVRNFGLWTEKAGSFVPPTFAASRLWCSFYTPPPGAQLPTKSIYPTTFYNPLPTSHVGTIAPDASQSVEITSNVITLNTAPDLIAIYYIPNMPDNNDGDIPETYTRASQITYMQFADGQVPTESTPPGLGSLYKGAALEDVVLAIDKLSIQWNNNPTLLSTFDARELWRRTRENGLPVTYPVFEGMLNDTMGTYALIPQRNQTISSNAIRNASPVVPGMIMIAPDTGINDRMGSWMRCDGKLLPISSFPLLFAAIGFRYSSAATIAARQFFQLPVLPTFGQMTSSTTPSTTISTTASGSGAPYPVTTLSNGTGTTAGATSQTVLGNGNVVQLTGSGQPLPNSMAAPSGYTANPATSYQYPAIGTNSALPTSFSYWIWTGNATWGRPSYTFPHYRSLAATPSTSPAITQLSTYVPTIGSSGSPVVLALNKDIPVELGVGSGVAGVYTLQIKATIKNQLPYTVTGGNLFIVPISSQYLVLNAGATSELLTTITDEATVAQTAPSGDVQDKTVLGAGAMTVVGASLAGSRSGAPSRLLDMQHRAPLADYSGGSAYASKRLRPF